MTDTVKEAEKEEPTPSIQPAEDKMEAEAEVPDPEAGVPGALSPLSGAYLLVILGEPLSDQHKEKMLQKLKQGLMSWDISSCHVDLNKELGELLEKSPQGEELKGGEKLIQFATSQLVVEVLIHPQIYTLQQCMKNMLSSFTKHRHLIHGGYTFAGNGAWILQDGSYMYRDFTHVFDEYDVQRVMRSYENSITVDVHCCEEGEWKQEKINKEQFTEFCQVKLNSAKMIESDTMIENFLLYLDPFLTPQSIQQSLPPSDVVGNIRFSHPTLYVFPGGQGDSALFGINGFNMLIDGGFSRKSCFWDFSRHLDRLDTVLVTRLSNENTCGMAALLQRKTLSGALYPQIGHVFTNLPTKGKGDLDSSNEESDRDDLIINLIQEGNVMLENLGVLNLKPQLCLRDRAQCLPINLYHKVGHGRLDMFVLNPSKDAKELHEFMERWNDNAKTLGNIKSGISIDGKEVWLPLANMVSICALIIWVPEKFDEAVTRLLFPGSTPQHKILRGFERVRHLEAINKPVCLAGSLPRPKAPEYHRSASYSYREKSSRRVLSSRAESARPQPKVDASESQTTLSEKKSVSRSEKGKEENVLSRMDKVVPGLETSNKRNAKSDHKKVKEQKNQAAEASARQESIKKGRIGSHQPKSTPKTPTEKKSGYGSKTYKDASNKTMKEKSAKKPVIKASATGKKAIQVPKTMKQTQQSSVEEEASIVEKHQIEEMEHVAEATAEKDEDDVEPELLKIKDDEEDHEVNREPDIPEASNDAEPAVEKPKDLQIFHDGKQVTHIKTPDEVDDLPEHEAVDMEVGEKDTVDGKMVDFNVSPSKTLTSTDIISPESEGIQQQRDSSEIIVSPSIKKFSKEEETIEKSEEQNEESIVKKELNAGIEKLENNGNDETLKNVQKPEKSTISNLQGQESPEKMVSTSPEVEEKSMKCISESITLEKVTNVLVDEDRDAGKDVQGFSASAQATTEASDNKSIDNKYEESDLRAKQEPVPKLADCELDMAEVAGSPTENEETRQSNEVINKELIENIIPEIIDTLKKAQSSEDDFSEHSNRSSKLAPDKEESKADDVHEKEFHIDSSSKQASNEAKIEAEQHISEQKATNMDETVEKRVIDDKNKMDNVAKTAMPDTIAQEGKNDVEESCALVKYESMDIKDTTYSSNVVYDASSIDTNKAVIGQTKTEDGVIVHENEPDSIELENRSEANVEKENKENDIEKDDMKKEDTLEEAELQESISLKVDKEVDERVQGNIEPESIIRESVSSTVSHKIEESKEETSDAESNKSVFEEENNSYSNNDKPPDYEERKDAAESKSQAMESIANDDEKINESLSNVYSNESENFSSSTKSFEDKEQKTDGVDGNNMEDNTNIKSPTSDTPKLKDDEAKDEIESKELKLADTNMAESSKATGSKQDDENLSITHIEEKTKVSEVSSFEIILESNNMAKDAVVEGEKEEPFDLDEKSTDRSYAEAKDTLKDDERSMPENGNIPSNTLENVQKIHTELECTEENIVGTSARKDMPDERENLDQITVIEPLEEASIGEENNLMTSEMPKTADLTKSNKNDIDPAKNENEEMASTKETLGNLDNESIDKDNNSFEKREDNFMNQSEKNTLTEKGIQSDLRLTEMDPNYHEDNISKGNLDSPEDVKDRELEENTDKVTADDNNIQEEKMPEAGKESPHSDSKNPSSENYINQETESTQIMECKVKGDTDEQSGDQNETLETEKNLADIYSTDIQIHKIENEIYEEVTKTTTEKAIKTAPADVEALDNKSEEESKELDIQNPPKIQSENENQNADGSDNSSIDEKPTDKNLAGTGDKAKPDQPGTSVEEYQTLEKRESDTKIDSISEKVSKNHNSKEIVSDVKKIDSLEVGESIDSKEDSDQLSETKMEEQTSTDNEVNVVKDVDVGHEIPTEATQPEAERFELNDVDKSTDVAMGEKNKAERTCESISNIPESAGEIDIAPENVVILKSCAVLNAEVDDKVKLKDVAHQIEPSANLDDPVSSIEVVDDKQQLDEKEETLSKSDDNEIDSKTDIKNQYDHTAALECKENVDDSNPIKISDTVIETQQESIKLDSTSEILSGGEKEVIPNADKFADIQTDEKCEDEIKEMDTSRENKSQEPLGDIQGENETVEQTFEVKDAIENSTTIREIAKTIEDATEEIKSDQTVLTEISEKKLSTDNGTPEKESQESGGESGLGTGKVISTDKLTTESSVHTTADSFRDEVVHRVFENTSGYGGENIIEQRKSDDEIPLEPSTDGKNVDSNSGTAEKEAKQISDDEMKYTISITESEVKDTNDCKDSKNAPDPIHDNKNPDDSTINQEMSKSLSAKNDEKSHSSRENDNATEEEISSPQLDVKTSDNCVIEVQADKVKDEIENQDSSMERKDQHQSVRLENETGSYSTDSEQVCSSDSNEKFGTDEPTKYGDQYETIGLSTESQAIILEQQSDVHIQPSLSEERKGNSEINEQDEKSQKEGKTTAHDVRKESGATANNEGGIETEKQSQTVEIVNVIKSADTINVASDESECKNDGAGQSSTTASQDKTEILEVKDLHYQVDDKAQPAFADLVDNSQAIYVMNQKEAIEKVSETADLIIENQTVNQHATAQLKHETEKVDITQEAEIDDVKDNIEEIDIKCPTNTVDVIEAQIFEENDQIATTELMVGAGSSQQSKASGFKTETQAVYVNDKIEITKLKGEADTSAGSATDEAEMNQDLATAFSEQAVTDKDQNEILPSDDNDLTKTAQLKIESEEADPKGQDITTTEWKSETLMDGTSELIITTKFTKEALTGGPEIKTQLLHSKDEPAVCELESKIHIEDNKESAASVHGADKVSSNIKTKAKVSEVEAKPEEIDRNDQAGADKLQSDSQTSHTPEEISTVAVENTNSEVHIKDQLKAIEIETDKQIIDKEDQPASPESKKESETLIARITQGAGASELGDENSKLGTKDHSSITESDVETEEIVIKSKITEKTGVSDYGDEYATEDMKSQSKTTESDTEEQMVSVKDQPAAPTAGLMDETVRTTSSESAREDRGENDCSADVNNKDTQKIPEKNQCATVELNDERTMLEGSEVSAKEELGDENSSADLKDQPKTTELDAETSMASVKDQPTAAQLKPEEIMAESSESAEEELGGKDSSSDLKDQSKKEESDEETQIILEKDQQAAAEVKDEKTMVESSKSIQEEEKGKDTSGDVKDQNKTAVSGEETQKIFEKDQQVVAELKSETVTVESSEVSTKRELGDQNSIADIKDLPKTEESDKETQKNLEKDQQAVTEMKEEKTIVESSESIQEDLGGKDSIADIKDQPRKTVSEKETQKLSEQDQHAVAELKDETVMFESPEVSEGEELGEKNSTGDVKDQDKTVDSDKETKYILGKEQQGAAEVKDEKTMVESSESIQEEEAGTDTSADIKDQPRKTEPEKETQKFLEQDQYAVAELEDETVMFESSEVSAGEELGEKNSSGDVKDQDKTVDSDKETKYILGKEQQGVAEVKDEKTMVESSESIQEEGGTNTSADVKDQNKTAVSGEETQKILEKDQQVVAELKSEAVTVESSGVSTEKELGDQKSIADIKDLAKIEESDMETQKNLEKDRQAVTEVKDERTIVGSSESIQEEEAGTDTSADIKDHPRKTEPEKETQKPLEQDLYAVAELKDETVVVESSEVSAEEELGGKDSSSDLKDQSRKEESDEETQIILEKDQQAAAEVKDEKTMVESSEPIHEEEGGKDTSADIIDQNKTAESGEEAQKNLEKDQKAIWELKDEIAIVESSQKSTREEVGAKETGVDLPKVTELDKFETPLVSVKDESATAELKGEGVVIESFEVSARDELGEKNSTGDVKDQDKTVDSDKETQNILGKEQQGVAEVKDEKTVVESSESIQEEEKGKDTSGDMKDQNKTAEFEEIQKILEKDKQVVTELKSEAVTVESSEVSTERELGNQNSIADIKDLPKTEESDKETQKNPEKDQQAVTEMKEEKTIVESSESIQEDLGGKDSIADIKDQPRKTESEKETQKLSEQDQYAVAELKDETVMFESSEVSESKVLREKCSSSDIKDQSETIDAAEETQKFPEKDQQAEVKDEAIMVQSTEVPTQKELGDQDYNADIKDQFKTTDSDTETQMIHVKDQSAATEFVSKTITVKTTEVLGEVCFEDEISTLSGNEMTEAMELNIQTQAEGPSIASALRDETMVITESITKVGALDRSDLEDEIQTITAKDQSGTKTVESVAETQSAVHVDQPGRAKSKDELIITQVTKETESSERSDIEEQIQRNHDEVQSETMESNIEAKLVINSTAELRDVAAIDEGSKITGASVISPGNKVQTAIVNDQSETMESDFQPIAAEAKDEARSIQGIDTSEFGDKISTTCIKTTESDIETQAADNKNNAAMVEFNSETVMAEVIENIQTVCITSKSNEKSEIEAQVDHNKGQFAPDDLENKNLAESSSEESAAVKVGDKIDTVDIREPQRTEEPETEILPISKGAPELKYATEMDVNTESNSASELKVDTHMAEGAQQIITTDEDIQELQSKSQPTTIELDKGTQEVDTEKDIHTDEQGNVIGETTLQLKRVNQHLTKQIISEQTLPDTTETTESDKNEQLDAVTDANKQIRQVENIVGISMLAEAPEAPQNNEQLQEENAKQKEGSISQTSDCSQQEIPSMSPQSDPTLSPSDTCSSINNVSITDKVHVDLGKEIHSQYEKHVKETPENVITVVKHISTDTSKSILTSNFEEKTEIVSKTSFESKPEYRVVTLSEKEALPEGETVEIVRQHEEYSSTQQEREDSDGCTKKLSASEKSEASKTVTVDDKTTSEAKSSTTTVTDVTNRPCAGNVSKSVTTFVTTIRSDAPIDIETLKKMGLLIDDGAVTSGAQSIFTTTTTTTSEKASAQTPSDSQGAGASLTSPLVLSSHVSEDSGVISEEISAASTTLKEEDAKAKLESWGKPLGLPSPLTPAPKASLSDGGNTKKRDPKVYRESKKPSSNPIYLDLAYVPQHGDARYVGKEFFRRIRARYYVFSGVDPSREVFQALLDAKKEWEDKDAEVTIIPTYDTDALGYWVADTEEELILNKIDLAPAASRCTINLQDHETSCAAYRLEF